MSDATIPKVLVHLLVRRADGVEHATPWMLSRVPSIGEHVCFPSGHPRRDDDARVYKVTGVLHFDMDGREGTPVAEVFARESEEPTHWRGDSTLS